MCHKQCLRCRPTWLEAAYMKAFPLRETSSRQLRTRRGCFRPSLAWSKTGTRVHRPLYLTNCCLILFAVSTFPPTMTIEKLTLHGRKANPLWLWSLSQVFSDWYTTVYQLMSAVSLNGRSTLLTNYSNMHDLFLRSMYIDVRKMAACDNIDLLKSAFLSSPQLYICTVEARTLFTSV